MTKEDKKLKEIKQKVLACQKCSLFQTRKYPVIGQGNHQAELMFIGEAPGRQEDKTGVPFCGPAGHILDELLNSVKIKREDVYITNILKCRPPNNRDPQEKEVKECSVFLEKQIKVIQPQIICSLGRHAMIFLMNRFMPKKEIDSISRIHGQVFDINIFSQKIKFIPLYHPAVAIYNSNMKDFLKKDIKTIKDYLK